MSRIFSLCLLIFSVQFVQAQYKPFPTSSVYWLKIYNLDANTPFNYEVGELFFPEGDTLINGETYTKMYSSYLGDRVDYAEYENKHAKDSAVYSFGYRNDSLKKRVYKVNLQDTIEKLWYDFDLAIGDTLKSIPPPDFIDPPFYLIVDKIETQEYCGVQHNSYQYKNCDPFQNNMIEGMGFDANFIKYEHECVWFEPNSTCSTQLNYEACYEPYFQDILTSSPSLLSPFKSLSLFPNPSLGSVTIEGVSSSIQLDIYSIHGELIKSKKLEKIDSSIQVKNSGIYLFTFSNSEFSTTKKVIIR